MELLSVVAIIGVLAALVLAGLARMREAGRRAHCTSNIRQLSTAMLLYAGENRGRFPSIANNPPAHGGGCWATALITRGLLPKNHRSVLACPSDTENIEVAEARTAASPSGKIFVPLSYHPVAPALATRNPVNNWFNVTVPRILATIDNPASVYMLTEHHGRYDQEAPNGYWAFALNDGNYVSRDLFFIPKKVTSSTRHADGARNFAFMDGHVEYRRPAQGMATVPVWGPAN